MKKIYEPDYLYTEGEVKEHFCVVTDENKIVEIGESKQIRKKYPDAEIETWKNMIMLPGTVNVHNHSFQSLLRGIACDRPFLEWRDKALYRYSPRMTRDDIYNGAVFAFAEMMKYGVTTVCDFFYLHNFGIESDEMVVKAAKDVGIRLVLARTMYDWKGAPEGYVEDIDTAVSNTRKLFGKYSDDDMVYIVPAPHSLHAASPEMIQAGHSLAKELGVKFHIHVAEEPFEVEQVMEEHGGMTPVELLDQLGVVDRHIVIVHGVWLKASEISLLGKKGGSLAYCPSSNMFLADGVTNLPQMLKCNVNVGLGSDGACSNNRISIFEEMRMASLLQKATYLDALCVDYKDSFSMGTKNGGKILDLPVGEITVGYRADFVGVRIDTMSMQPISESKEQILPNLVYSMQPDAIDKVVVDGRLTVEYGKILSMREEHVVALVGETMHRLEEG